MNNNRFLKTIVIGLVVVLAITCIPIVGMSDVVYARETSDIADEGWIGDFRYVKSIYNGWFRCIEIVEYKPSEERKTVEVPSNVENWPVVIIGENAFEGVTAEKIVLPDSIKEIKKRAFMNSQVSEILLPEKLRIVGEEAFCGISDMESIHVPRGLYQLGANAFKTDGGALLTIYGYEDSLAYEYANDNENPFISMGKVLDSKCWSETLNYAGNIYSYNSDLELSAKDALEILKYVVGLESVADEKNADADQNGTVDVEDALYVLKCAVKLEEPIVLGPNAYEIYQFEMVGSDYDYTGNMHPDEYRLDNDYKIIKNTEELKEFIEGDLQTYYGDMDNLQPKQRDHVLKHFASLNDEFFKDNIYVVVLDAYTSYLSSYTMDCLENVFDEEGQVCGKRLKMVYGSLEDNVMYPTVSRLNVYAGVVVPKSDLYEVDILEVVVD